MVKVESHRQVGSASTLIFVSLGLQHAILSLQIVSSRKRTNAHIDSRPVSALCSSSMGDYAKSASSILVMNVL